MNDTRPDNKPEPGQARRLYWAPADKYTDQMNREELLTVVEQLAQDLQEEQKRHQATLSTWNLATRSRRNRRSWGYRLLTGRLNWSNSNTGPSH
jgi:hypothetical protein